MLPNFCSLPTRAFHVGHIVDRESSNHTGLSDCKAQICSKSRHRYRHFTRWNNIECIKLLNSYRVLILLLRLAIVRLPMGTFDVATFTRYKSILDIFVISKQKTENISRKLKLLAARLSLNCSFRIKCVCGLVQNVVNGKILLVTLARCRLFRLLRFLCL